MSVPAPAVSKQFMSPDGDAAPSGLAYPVRDGIPVMLESEARQLTLEERERG